MGGSEANNNRRLRSRPNTAVSFPPGYILLLDDRAVNNELEELNNNNTGLVNRASDVSHYIDYRGRRFRQRFYTGFDAHSGEIARWFVLTESDEAIDRALFGLYYATHQYLELFV